MSSRDKILARRAAFMAAALTSISGCSSSDPTGPPDPPADSGTTRPEACLSPPFDTGAQPCLTDLGPPMDTTADDTTVTDTGAMPCLSPPPGDTG